MVLKKGDHELDPGGPSSFSLPRGDFERLRSTGWSLLVGGETAGEPVSAGSLESRLARALRYGLVIL